MCLVKAEIFRWPDVITFYLYVDFDFIGIPFDYARALMFNINMVDCYAWCLPTDYTNPFTFSKISV